MSTTAELPSIISVKLEVKAADGNVPRGGEGPHHDPTWQMHSHRSFEGKPGMRGREIHSPILHHYMLLMGEGEYSHNTGYTTLSFPI